MPYERKKLNVLTGSLNLLQPADKIPAEDAQQLENFRSDQYGALRSTPGKFPIAATAGGGRVHSLSRWGDVFYIGAGSNLYRYPDVTTPVVSTLSGQPIGMAFMNGYAWIMDRSFQGKGTGATVSTWAVETPASAPAVASSGDNSDLSGLTGTYRYYVTFAKSDAAESNPSPVSASVVLNQADGLLASIPIGTGADIVKRYIYREGGTLGQPYRVGTLNDNSTTAFTDNMSDVDATAIGLQLEFDHGAPPPACGLVGPYFARLLAFNSADHPNRLWWTKPGIPDYFPGAALDDGQWVDVGDDNEAILAITLKARVAIIYKERSIWRLTGDPDTGYLERCNAKHGLVGRHAVADGGSIDYCVFAEGFYLFDGDNATKLSLKLDPLFQGRNVPLGGELVTPAINGDRASQIAVEYANGRVLISYPEGSGDGNDATLIYDVDSGRFSTMRCTQDGSTDGGFSVITYVHPEIWAGNQSAVYRIEMAQGSAAGGYADPAGPINSYWQGRYEDCGHPDNPKVFTDLVIEAETGSDAATVIVLKNNGVDPVPAYMQAIGSIAAPNRSKTTFSFSNGGNQGLEATNLAIRIEATATSQIVIHAVYLYYYVEARFSTSVATIPFELFKGRVLQVKEMQIDADNPGALIASLWSDLPGNQLTLRTNPTIAASIGRRPYMAPFATLEGRLFRFTATSPTPFRLYGARLLVRPIGVYVEGYEASTGFIWDSMEMDFSSGVTHVQRGAQISLYADPIKRAREIELQIETSGKVYVTLLSDLPGSYLAQRFQATVDTSGGSGRRVVRIPLPGGTAAPIEGRLFRLLLSGQSQFKLYAAAIEILPIGVYLEGYEATAGAIYDSREIDFGTPQVKEIREIELDVEATGNVTAVLYTDVPGAVMAQRWTATKTTNGRQKLTLAVPQVEAKQLRLTVSGADAFALYGARAFVRAYGQYLTADEGGSGAFWDSTELNLGNPSVKQLRELELDIWAVGQAVVSVYTDLPGNSMVLRQQITIGPTTTRTTKMVPLQQGQVPDNYLFGRLVRVTISSPQAVKLFGARVHARAIGVYIEGYESTTGACWDSTPIDAGGTDRAFDQVRFEMDSDGPVLLSVYSDLPNETMAQRFQTYITFSATSRRWVTVPLAPGLIEGRSIRLIVSGVSGFRLYRAQTRARSIGRYIAPQGTQAVTDGFRTLDYDYESERVKQFKKLEVDIETNGPLTLTVSTNQSGVMAAVYSTVLDTGGARETLKLPLPLNIRGRLMRVEIAGASSARLYRLRTWLRATNEPRAAWLWRDYPLEQSEVVPGWTDLPLAETPPLFSWQELPVAPTATTWTWAPFPVAPTDAQWNWAKVLAVDETPDRWEWVEVPGVSGLEVEG